MLIADKSLDKPRSKVRSEHLAVFRADAGARIGGGHVMRCLTLAETLIGAGWRVGFACVAETMTVVPQLTDKVERLEAAETALLDADALAQRWPEGCDVLVVDHYGLDTVFEITCRGWARRIVVIDDLADRPHDCDLLVDTTPGRAASDYATLIPAEAMVLAGPAYALLRPEFAAWRERAIARREKQTAPSRVLVSLGLTDLGGITERVVRAVLPLGPVLTIDVVVGAATASKSALADLAAETPFLTIHFDPPEMAALMAQADLAIGAAGTTSWERCCLGLPTVLLLLADNQRFVGQQLAERGAAIAAPSPEDQGFTEIVAALLADAPRLAHFAANAALITDGQGAGRVGFAIRGLGASFTNGLKLRLATAEDSALVWAWRNDPVSRAAFRDDVPVPRSVHDRWFMAALKDPCRILLLGVVENEPVGVVRFDRYKESNAEVSINLAPERRGVGLGLKLLEAACARAEEDMATCELLATVKSNNMGSRHIFEACGFMISSHSGEYIQYLRTRSPFGR